jgi:hypothetical protein
MHVIFIPYVLVSSLGRRVHLCNFYESFELENHHISVLKQQYPNYVTNLDQTRYSRFTVRFVTTFRCWSSLVCFSHQPK